MTAREGGGTREGPGRDQGQERDGTRRRKSSSLGMLIWKWPVWLGLPPLASARVSACLRLCPPTASLMNPSFLGWTEYDFFSFCRSQSATRLNCRRTRKNTNRSLDIVTPLADLNLTT